MVCWRIAYMHFASSVFRMLSTASRWDCQMCLVRSVCPFSFASHFAWYGQSLQFFGELRYDDTDRLLNTTENMLVATRLETGRDSFKMRPERVDGVLRAAVEQLGRQASEHKLSVVVNDPALTAVMDPELIRRVLPSN